MSQTDFYNNEALAFSGNIETSIVYKSVINYLQNTGLKITEIDLDRPWGSFVRISEECSADFLKHFFPTNTQIEILQNASLTPKILIVNPKAKLSWQYHNRRQEIWSIVSGPVGIITSETDEQSDQRIVNYGEVIAFGANIRHRLCGLDSYGVVAEFWKHTDRNNLSNEADIIRVEDDFSRS